MTVFAQADNAIYSASAEESDIIDCRFEFHITGVPKTAPIIPDVDLRVSKHPAQSASEKNESLGSLPLGACNLVFPAHTSSPSWLEHSVFVWVHARF